MKCFTSLRRLCWLQVSHCAIDFDDCIPLGSLSTEGLIAVTGRRPQLAHCGCFAGYSMTTSCLPNSVWLAAQANWSAFPGSMVT